jgi:hypothetical protein
MPSVITWEVMIDWDATDWAATPDFSEGYDDISADVKSVRWVRGKDVEAGNAPASTLEIRITPGLCSYYSPETSDTLSGLIRPWLPIRVRTTGTFTHNIFFGYISKIAINPHTEVQSVYLYCTDGIDLLARQLITQDWDTRTSMSDGDAITAIADVAGWSATRRDIDVDGGADLLNYPSVHVY